MPREKPPAPAPAPPVVSTGCSGLMSCLSCHRRGGPQQQQPQPRRSDDGCAGDAAFEAAEKCWKRVRLLEEEVKRLSGHEVRPAPGPGVAEGGGEAADRAGNGAKATAKGGGSSSSASTGTTAAATRRAGAGAGVGHGACCGVQEVVRLEDGSYMREVRRVGRPWERLALQVSRPAVPADAASAPEVLGKMAAMSAEGLCRFLVQLMPLKDITGQKNPGEPVRRTARPISGDDLVEALVLDAMGKLEALALEGLKIQMASPAAEAAVVATAGGGGDGRRDKAVSKDCMVHVVLMQARDPRERYCAIGDPMIGLIETSLEKKDAAARLRMLGLHVAGISFVIRRPSDGRCVLWSAYLRRCKESHDGDGGGGGDGCRCICVRNPNRVLPSV